MWASLSTLSPVEFNTSLLLCPHHLVLPQPEPGDLIQISQWWNVSVSNFHYCFFCTQAPRAAGVNCSYWRLLLFSFQQEIIIHLHPYLSSAYSSLTPITFMSFSVQLEISTFVSMEVPSLNVLQCNYCPLVQTPLTLSLQIYLWKHQTCTVLLVYSLLVLIFVNNWILCDVPS